MERDTTRALARSVRQRRTGRDWTIDQLVARSGVSKGAVVAVENGSTNPSLSTLVRLADALGISVTELLGEQPIEPVRVIPHDTLTPLWQGPNGGRAILILTVPGPSPVELWEWTLAPGERYQGSPHPRGFVETLTVLAGTMELAVGGDALTVRSGETATFGANCEHAYAAGDGQLRVLMTVHLPASGSAGSRLP